VSDLPPRTPPLAAPGGDFKTGAFVRHATRPEWGLGKVVYVDDGHVHVYFTDLEAGPGEAVVRLSRAAGMLFHADVKSDVILDHLPALSNGKLPSRCKVRITEKQAVDRFTSSYSNFDSDGYLRAERHYAWQTHLLVAEWFQSDEGRRLLTAGPSEELAYKIRDLLALTSLLTSRELAAVQEMFEEIDAASRFAAATLAFVNSPSEVTFNRLVGITGNLPAEFGRAPVLTWPVVTALPFLANPMELVFLKPEVTRRMADALCFDLLYDACPTWTTYRRLQRWHDHLLARLRPLGARDFIDVHGFLSVVAASGAAKSSTR
jgi:hypothetical protein